MPELPPVRNINKTKRNNYPTWRLKTPSVTLYCIGGIILEPVVSWFKPVFIYDWKTMFYEKNKKQFESVEIRWKVRDFEPFHFNIMDIPDKSTPLFRLNMHHWFRGKEHQFVDECCWSCLGKKSYRLIFQTVIPTQSTPLIPMQTAPIIPRKVHHWDFFWIA